MTRAIRRVDDELRELVRDHRNAITHQWRFGLTTYSLWPSRPWEWMHGWPFLDGWFQRLPEVLPGMKSADE